MDTSKVPQSVLDHIDNVLGDAKPEPAAASGGPKAGVFQGRAAEVMAQRGTQAPRRPQSRVPQDVQMQLEEESLRGDAPDEPAQVDEADEIELEREQAIAAYREDPEGFAAEHGDEFAEQVRGLAEEGAPSAESVPALDVSLRYGLIQKTGLSPSAVDAMYKADPAGTLRILQQNPTAEQAKPSAAADKFSKAVEALRKNRAGFVDKHGEEIADLMEGLADRYGALEKSHTDMVRESTFAERDRVTNGLGTQWPKLVGTSAEKLTHAQAQFREKMFNVADDLRNGERRRGGNMSINAALKSALNLMTAGMQKEQARGDVRRQVVTRRNRMTLRPGTRNTAEPKLGKKETAMALYQERFHELTGEDA